QIPAVPNGTYDVRADGYLVAGPAQLTVNATPLTGLQVVVTAGATLSGSVVAQPDGAPLANAVVSAAGAAGVAFAVTTDANGLYQFGGLPRDTSQVDVPADGYTAATAGGVVVSAGAVVTNVILTPSVAARVVGTVSGPAGFVASAAVTATAPD